MELGEIKNMKKFENFWNELQIELKTPKKINNWTMKKRAIAEDFTAQVKNEKYITCEIVNGIDQNVPKKDFQLVYDNWEGYLSGKILRSEFCNGKVDTSRFSKYTISIIHQFLK